MSKPCPLCGKNKAQRHCARQDQTQICSLCCVEKRDPSCGDCAHYVTAQQYRALRQAPRAPGPRALPDGHFIIDVSPEVAEAVDDALELAQKGQMDRAEVMLDRLLRERPGNHTVLYAIGTVHSLRGEHQEAIKWYDRAIAIYPYYFEAHFNRAVGYKELLDIGNAIRAFRKAVEVGDPGDPEVESAQSFLDDMAKSIRKTQGLDLDAFLELQTEFNRAYDLMERGEWLNALEGFRAVVAKDERHSPSHGNMGLCYAQLGRKAKALAELDRALELDPSYEPAIINRVAIVRMEEGRPLGVGSIVRTEYGKERVQREQSGRPSLLSDLTSWWKNRIR